MMKVGPGCQIARSNKSLDRFDGRAGRPSLILFSAGAGRFSRPVNVHGPRSNDGAASGRGKQTAPFRDPWDVILGQIKPSERALVFLVFFAAEKLCFSPDDAEHLGIWIWILLEGGLSTGGREKQKQKEKEVQVKIKGSIGDMQLSTLLASVLAVTASAAPTYPKFEAKDARSAVDSLGSLSDYFNLLAYKVKSAKISAEAPVCDLSQAKMPLGMSLQSTAPPTLERAAGANM
ncbi:hypothetical protein NM208_g16885 [Fusarium decemcellulare]|uniref:Uncharacterized protein n=1 Tax=Fusarium decemcellulare TaxID=57161 RepID=A0ACC1R8Y3_9HYPO|nr:hypothetical protein NM208_g16885 [Fusarium decemcellulare]